MSPVIAENKNDKASWQQHENSIIAWVNSIRPWVMWALVVYSTVALAFQFSVVLNGQVVTYGSFPTDRCAKLYIYASSLPSPAKVIYGYSLTGLTVNVRVCASNTTNEFKKLASYAEQVSVTDFLGCDPTNKVSYAKMVANCKPSGTNLNCSQILQTAPFPTGVMWKYAAAGTSDSSCAPSLRDISNSLKSGSFETCDQENVSYFRKKDTAVGVIVGLAIFFELVIQFLLFGYAGDAGLYETVVGFVYLLDDEKKKLFAESIMPGYIRLWKILLTDIYICIVAGVASIASCPASRMPWMVVLVVFKCFQFLNDGYFFYRDKAYLDLDGMWACPTNSEMSRSKEIQLGAESRI